MSKKIYAPFFILAFIYLSFAQSGLKFIAKKEKFKAGEDVCFELINDSKETFYLPSSAPWVVFENETEKIVYSPIALQRIEKLKPGEKKSWLISRILGYIRDLTVAYIFGASIFTDAFFIAWRLPNTFRQVLGEGSLNAVFIPIYRRIEREGKNPERFMDSIFTEISVILFFLTAFFILFAPYITAILAPGFVGETVFEEAVKLVRFVFPYIIFAVWVAFFMAILNIKGIFFLPALSPAFLNISFIISAIFLSEHIGIYALAVGAVVGGILQVIVLLKPVFSRYRLKPHISFDSNVKDFFKSQSTI